MTDNSSVQDAYRPSKSNPDLKSLDRLVGVWKISGPDIDGTVRYEWAQGSFFMLPHVDFVHGGRKIKGIEVIGHFQSFGEEPSKDIKSRFYSFLDGMTLDYVYEIDDDTLTIWGGELGSPAYYKGKFSDYGNTNTGRWAWPEEDGKMGGYDSTMTRAKQPIGKE